MKVYKVLIRVRSYQPLWSARRAWGLISEHTQKYEKDIATFPKIGCLFAFDSISAATAFIVKVNYAIRKSAYPFTPEIWECDAKESKTHPKQISMFLSSDHIQAFWEGILDYAILHVVPPGTVCCDMILPKREINAVDG